MMTTFFFLSFFVAPEIGSFFSFIYFSLLVYSLSCVWLFATPWTAACQACPSPSPTPGACLNSCPLSQWCHPTVVLCHPLCHPLLFLPSIFPSIRVFFQWVGSSHQVGKVLKLQHQSFQWMFRVDFLQDRLVKSPCSPTNTQEFSPAPQFESISSSVISILSDPTQLLVWFIIVLNS